MSAPAILSSFGVDTARARRTDPSTSHEAADINDVSRSTGAVLNLLREEGPMIDGRGVVRLTELGYKFSPERYRSARKALQDMGHVRWTGEYGKTSRGRNAQVFEAIPQAPKRPVPFADERECSVCDVTSIVEVEPYTLGLTRFEDWQCTECRHWNTREVTR